MIPIFKKYIYMKDDEDILALKTHPVTNCWPATNCLLALDKFMPELNASLNLCIMFLDSLQNK